MNGKDHSSQPDLPEIRDEAERSLRIAAYAAPGIAAFAAAYFVVIYLLSAG
jgi:hypothetical protein